jgi:hypothetical protein
MTVIQNLKNEEYKDYDQIKIVVENNSTTYENTYEMDKLANTISLLNNVQKFFEYSYKRDTLNLKTIISPTDISDSSILTLIGAAVILDSMYGKLNAVNLTGFRYDQIKETSEPLIIAWAETTNGSSLTNYTFYISEQKKKIIYVGINNKT